MASIWISDCQTEGKAYTGKRFVTVTGLVCQRWDAQTPHPHSYTSSSMFPEDSVSEVENLCRNPDNRLSGPWCYTMSDDVTQETCGVSICAGAGEYIHTNTDPRTDRHTHTHTHTHAWTFTPTPFEHTHLYRKRILANKNINIRLSISYFMKSETFQFKTKCLRPTPRL